MTFLRTYGLLSCMIVMVLLLAARHFYALPKMSYKGELVIPANDLQNPILLPQLSRKSSGSIFRLDYQ